MKFETLTAPALTPSTSVRKVMLEVVFALIPGYLLLVVFFGWGVIVNALIAVLTALAVEALSLKLAGKNPKPFLNDYSAVVTALLLAAAIPPLLPWWMTVIAVAFGLGIGKHLYGGLGFNPFNPAMLGYVVLLIAFPREMTQWLPTASLTEATPGPLSALAFIFTGSNDGQMLDAITGATPIDNLKIAIGLRHTIEETVVTPEFGGIGGAGWEWVNLGFLIGGLWLLWRRIIEWRIPLAMLGALAVWAFLSSTMDADRFPGIGFVLFSGGTMLAAFFIATDPVTASATPLGKLIYGGSIGGIVYVIRTWGGYPDGIAFAVLIMNAAAPMIDYYTRPRAFGEPRS